MIPKIPAAGLRFECTGCGDCCRSRGRKSYVYTALDERRRLAKHLGMRTAAFTRKYCEKSGDFWHLKDPSSDCLFLDGARCTVYAARPSQCRTFPFWAENLGARGWTPDVKRDCEGLDRGRRFKPAEIEVRLLEDISREQMD